MFKKNQAMAKKKSISKINKSVNSMDDASFKKLVIEELANIISEIGRNEEKLNEIKSILSKNKKN